MPETLPATTPVSSLLRVGLAQIDSRLGNVEANLERHLAQIAAAHEQGVELLVFPELSLTGYRLLHLTPRVALRLGDPGSAAGLARLGAAAGSMAVVVGLVEEDERGVLKNSALLFQGGVITLVHQKIYLPTYGIFQEERFMGAGKRLQLAQVGGSRAGILICEDLWHSSLANRLAVAGAKLLICPSVSPGRIGPGEVPANQDSWELVTRSTALLNTCWVLYCNRVGWEEGSFYNGGSHVVRPGGEIACRAPLLDEHLLVADIDLREADRLRWKLPLIDDERTDIEGPA